jgi:hypothetical protein
LEILSRPSKGSVQLDLINQFIWFCAWGESLVGATCVVPELSVPQIGRV